MKFPHCIFKFVRIMFFKFYSSGMLAQCFTKVFQEVQNYYGTRLLLIAQKEWSFCHFAKLQWGPSLFHVGQNYFKNSAEAFNNLIKRYFQETCFSQIHGIFGHFFKQCEILCPNRSLTENNGTKSQFPVLEKFLSFFYFEKLKSSKMCKCNCVYITVWKF